MADVAPALLGISVCYASDKQVWLRALQVAPGTTIGVAIERSGVLEAFPAINLTTQPVGVYAKKKTLETVLRERDRIEIYRPLVADPKESRRKRAARRDGASDSPAAPD
ncbi:RnfH family protein [Massilia aurea]|uniref:RnfH family protein n=1 Tax=Massilia aurea TaxID=373040 RepID=UPI003462BC54